MAKKQSMAQLFKTWLFNEATKLNCSNEVCDPTGDTVLGEWSIDMKEAGEKAHKLRFDDNSELVVHVELL